MSNPASPWTIEQVAAFEHQVTGVSVSEHNRIFVNFPRWTEDCAVSVAEVDKDGALRPYPDEAWNAWRNARKDELPPEQHWVCVQSIVADGRGSLWVLTRPRRPRRTWSPAAPSWCRSIWRATAWCAASPSTKKPPRRAPT